MLMISLYCQTELSLMSKWFTANKLALNSDKSNIPFNSILYSVIRLLKTSMANCKIQMGKDGNKQTYAHKVRE
jgi:hypothetical protein